MPKESNPIEYKPRTKFYRKRRVLSSEEFIDQNQTSLEELNHSDPRRNAKTKGLYCKNCRRRIIWKHIKFAYEVDEITDEIVRRVTCGDCGDELKEETLPTL